MPTWRHGLRDAGQGPPNVLWLHLGRWHLRLVSLLIWVQRPIGNLVAAAGWDSTGRQEQETKQESGGRASEACCRKAASWRQPAQHQHAITKFALKRGAHTQSQQISAPDRDFTILGFTVAALPAAFASHLAAHRQGRQGRQAGGGQEQPGREQQRDHLCGAAPAPAAVKTVQLLQLLADPCMQRSAPLAQLT